MVTKEGEVAHISEEEIIIDIPRSEVRPFVPKNTGMVHTEVTTEHIEKMARGFILGTQSMSRRKDIRVKLEERVTKRIGAKGKYLTDKLFELIDGVYIVDKAGGREVRYYKVPPNLSAIVYSLDRVLGKPKQHVEKEESKKGIYVVEHIIRNLAAPAPAVTPAQTKNENGA